MDTNIRNTVSLKNSCSVNSVFNKPNIIVVKSKIL